MGDVGTSQATKAYPLARFLLFAQEGKVGNSTAARLKASEPTQPNAGETDVKT
jgi:hypothetical protein